MTRAKIVETRVELLKDMNKFIFDHVNDEDVLLYWLGEGIPDGADDDDYYFIAEEEEEWIRICSIFGKIAKNFT